MVSYLEVLIFNRSSECWRSQIEEANRTASKQRSKTEATKPDALNSSAVPRNFGQKGLLMVSCQRAVLAESNPHRKHIRLTVGNVDQTLTLVVHGLNCPYRGVWCPVLPNHPPQNSLRDAVERLLHVHKIHLDWLELHCTL